MIYFVTFVRPKKNSMTYQETLHYLYTRVPMFQQSGASAYKPGLGTTIALDDHLSNPHKAYKTIHVAGTNGKGSVSHLLAAILRQAGYKVGLYTSPHLLDFRERIRVNGEKASESYVVDFVERHRAFFEPLHPSFFELTTAMAFQYFKEQAVDIAVIEVGLGGRLDCTNIITPLLGIITNISFDHTQFLGNTLGQIAAEKAGIAKAGVPLLLGESAEPVIYDTIAQKAKEKGALFHFAPEMALMADLDAMVSMDSGNMHLAAATGTSTVSIWGATHPAAGFGPVVCRKGQRHILLQDNSLDCRPCSIFGNKPCHRVGEGTVPPCMQAITPDMIADAVNAVITRQQP